LILYIMSSNSDEEMSKNTNYDIMIK